MARDPARRALASFRPALALAGAFGAVAPLYLLVLSLAGAIKRRAPSAAAGKRSFTILVPAHDEEERIGEAVASLNALEYPREQFRIVVVADNCSDRTAAIATEAGATVVERSTGGPEGKGRALAWAMEQLRQSETRSDAIAIVDADCRVSANLLASVNARLSNGADAVQANYVVANPAEAPAAALRFAAFALINTVRPLGKEELGLSAGLFGTGMAFTNDLLQRLPWTAFSLAEDAEYHLMLVDAGYRVAFAHEATVESPMPTSSRTAEPQQQRWEAGRWRLITLWGPRLLMRGALERDPVKINAAVELVVPPQSLLLVGNMLVGSLGLLAGSRRAARLATVSLAGQVIYILVGLRLVRAPREVYAALVQAPSLVCRKVWLYIRLFGGRRPTRWVRTSREPADSVTLT